MARVWDFSKYWRDALAPNPSRLDVVHMGIIKANRDWLLHFLAYLTYGPVHMPDPYGNSISISLTTCVPDS